jgi:hypothetical protein
MPFRFLGLVVLEIGVFDLEFVFLGTFRCFLNYDWGS